MKKIINKILLMSFIFIIVGCAGAQLLNIDNRNYITKPMQEEQVEKAIEAGGLAKGWRMKKINNGVIEASILVRSHIVIVNILYDSKGYEINYKNSTNLNYDAEKSTIHKNYNRWVKNLDINIKWQLSGV